MGTLFRIKLYARMKRRRSTHFAPPLTALHGVDGVLSDYKPDSELNRIAATAVGRPVHISKDFARTSASRNSSLARPAVLSI